MRPREIDAAYKTARKQYQEWGVDTERALETLAGVPISLHCWQGDDVAGFENSNAALGGGLAVTGAYPGRARTADELRADADQALALIPGKHRFNLHAMYGDFGKKVPDRNQIGPDHFQAWIAWAKARGLGLDFNPTFFAHPLAASGFTLSHPDKNVRAFWIEHGRRCREIGAAMGRALGSPCVTNVWIPDGFKDSPADRVAPRRRLLESLDEIFSRPISPRHNLDAVEGKLFGIGSESYVAGSHEFYFGFALTRGKLLCLDAGHYHPTESLADKISATLQFLPEILLHVSRGLHWDSDHVATWTDALREIAQEIVRGGFLRRVHLGLDYFDASINRVAAWVIGARNLQRALLAALLEPANALRQLELKNDFTARLAWQEELKAMPIGAVWNYFCLRMDSPPAHQWLAQTQRYERQVLSRRV